MIREKEADCMLMRRTSHQEDTITSLIYTLMSDHPVYKKNIISPTERNGL